MDSAGNLYGTASGGGAHGEGVVFKLTRYAKAWKETVLHSFSGAGDGGVPGGGVIIDNAGALYGTTTEGGDVTACAGGCGTVYQLAPVASGPWKLAVLHRFYRTDGAQPQGNLTVKSPSDFSAIYGTASAGGSQNCAGGCGTVYKLTAPAAGATTWTDAVLHDFRGGGDGAAPEAGVVLDAAGHINGTTAAGGPGNFGTAFQLPAQ